MSKYLQISKIRKMAGVSVMLLRQEKSLVAVLFFIFNFFRIYFLLESKSHREKSQDRKKREIFYQWFIAPMAVVTWAWTGIKPQFQGVFWVFQVDSGAHVSAEIWVTNGSASS